MFLDASLRSAPPSLPTVLTACLCALATATCLYLAGCNRSQTAIPSPAPSGTSSSTRSPAPGSSRTQHRTPTSPPSVASLVKHVTIIIMENHGYGEIIGNAEAPYINSLAKSSALFTNSYAISHPSEPNYLALYSGSTQGLTGDDCPTNFPGPSLGGELIGAHKTIRGYMEDLPSVGSTVCANEDYARKHNPLADFSDTPTQSSVPYVQISADMASNAYPTVAFIAPNLRDDMHDGTIAMGDQWLAANVPAILAFDATHKGLLILTWDEDDKRSGNQIATIAAGPMVIPGRYNQQINHYSVLRTVTNLFSLPVLNGAAPINGVLR